MCNGMPGLSERGTAARRRWQGQTVRAAIWKTPDDGPVMARRINLDGDGQADKMGRSGSVSPTKGPRGSSSMQLGRCGVIARSRSALLLCTRKRPSRSLAVGRPLRTRTKRLLARDRFPSRSCIGGRATARPLPPLSMRCDSGTQKAPRSARRLGGQLVDRTPSTPGENPDRTRLVQSHRLS